MKKIAIIIGILALPFAVYGATKVIQLNQFDFMASIQTANGGNVFIYKVQDGTTNCYVLTNDYSINSRTSGADFGISCVK